MSAYFETTHDIRVSVKPTFVRESKEKGVFGWVYEIMIENKSSKDVQLLKRRWEIINAQGFTHVVEGDGVVGEQPMIKPNDTYTYTSSVILETPSGFMKGQYLMTHKDQEFQVKIPLFPLDDPDYLPTKWN